jgi:methyl-accepting chemotaxis protein
MVGLTLVAVTLTIILKPLQALAKMTQELAGAGGDLNRRLNHQKNDELGEVCLGLNGFLDVLQPMVDTLKGSMHNLSGSATQAQIGSAESHNLMRQQRTEIDLVSSAMQQMTLAAHEVARSTESAARAASDIVVVVDNGTELIKQTSALVNRQIQDLGDANDQMRLLSERSERIGGVLDIIRGIAERTNLLALNAAIEAARAGEHGRGFAVVADEVRNLAKRTQDSIQEIHTIIDTLQRDTGIVVQSVTSTQVQSQELGELFINLVAALDQVGAGVAKIGEMNTQIASATEEQSAVSSDINRSVTSIGILTESLADQLEQSAGEIRSVGHCADEQRIMLERFRT